MVEQMEKWIHEETSDMAVLLKLFRSNAEVVRLQSINAALTRFKSVTGSSLILCSLILLVHDWVSLICFLFEQFSFVLYFYNREQHITSRVCWHVTDLDLSPYSLPTLGPKMNVI